MQIRRVFIVIVIALIVTIKGHAQYSKAYSNYKACYIGSTAFLLGNLVANNRPDFAQLNLGYRITEKDVVSIEVKTWKYAWSLGIPYGGSFESPEEKFPGYIREYGFALVYQRFLWKGLYTGIHVMNAWQSFVNDYDQKVGKGFQIFNTYRLGYHIKLFKDRFFLEPSIAITHRALHTKMPDEFKKLDDKWSKFFLGEPGFHLGFNF